MTEDKYFSQKELDKVYRRELKEKGKAAFDRSLENRSLHHGKKHSKEHVFLCHSHADKIIVERVWAFFKTLNRELYIDWMDHEMPEITNASTAHTIKSKINDCSKFIFLATARALQSKWCNWELGLAYSMKEIDHFAVFPIETWTGKWKGNEYLSLYPVIQKTAEIENLTISDLAVHFPDKQEKSFEEWLNS